MGSWNVLDMSALLYGFLPWIIPWAIVTTLVNEFLKRLIDQPRPQRSANRMLDGRPMPGMPSGHVLNSTTLMTWAMLEILFDGPDVAAALGGSVLIIFLQCPVPWARWHNGDHTAAQCIVSIFLGMIVGTVAFVIRMRHFPSVWKPW